MNQKTLKWVLKLTRIIIVALVSFVFGFIGFMSLFAIAWAVFTSADEAIFNASVFGCGVPIGILVSYVITKSAFFSKPNKIDSHQRSTWGFIHEIVTIPVFIAVTLGVSLSSSTIITFVIFHAWASPEALDTPGSGLIALMCIFALMIMLFAGIWILLLRKLLF